MHKKIILNILEKFPDIAIIEISHRQLNKFMRTTSYEIKQNRLELCD
jgi:hypothetical protein